MVHMSEPPTVVILRLPCGIARELDRRRMAEPDLPKRAEYITSLIAEALDEKTLLAHLICGEQLNVRDLGMSASHSILKRPPQ